MEILRIPNRYKKQMSRLKDKERLYIFDSLLSLSIGKDAKLTDTPEGDILELIWRDAIMMEKKNGNNGVENTGILQGEAMPSYSAGDSAGNPTPERKGIEKKGSEKKTYGEFENVFLACKEKKKLEDKFGEDGTRDRIENLSLYISSIGKDKYDSHYATILAWERKNNGGKDKKELTMNDHMKAFKDECGETPNKLRKYAIRLTYGEKYDEKMEIYNTKGWKVEGLMDAWNLWDSILTEYNAKYGRSF